MKRLPILLFAVSAVIFSCDKKQSEEKNAEKTDTIKTEEKIADNSVKPTLNPPHGEPHHRCDLEVGAPLNGSAPAQNSAPVAMPKQTPVNQIIHAKCVLTHQPPRKIIAAHAAHAF